MRFTIPFYFLIICFASCSSPKALIVFNSESSNINIQHIEKDETSFNILKPYKSIIDSSMQETIGFADYAMIKSKPFGALDSFFARTLFEFGDSISKDSGWDLNIALFNHGGLRSSLPSGAISIGNIFELMPFDNTLVFVNLKGNSVLEMIDYISERGGEPCWGIHLEDTNNIKINNLDLHLDSIYTIITSDYLLNGGDKMYFFQNNLGVSETNILIRDALIHSFQKSKSLKNE
jgi:2',3'-cyclic-nucleotide 2'-phosphodiesterase (5'-nucleotidase family)